MSEILSNGNELMVIKVSDLCRTCLTRENVIYDINDVVNGGTENLMEMLNIFRETMVTVKDSLPQRICEECMKQLKVAFAFGKKSLRSQNILTNIINKTNNLASKNTEIIENTKQKVIDEKGSTYNIHKPTIVLKPVSQDNNKSCIVKLVGGKYIPILKSHNVVMLNNNLIVNKLQFVENESKAKNENLNTGNKIESIDKDEQRQNNARFVNVSPVENNLKTIPPKIECLELTKPSNVTYKCVKCNGLYQSKELFISHVKSHHTERSNTLLMRTCSVCNITFDTLELLRNHNMLSHFSGSARPYKMKGKVMCSICNKECPSRNQLKHHLKLAHMFHSDTVCATCCGHFKNSNVLKKHLMKCLSSDVTVTCNSCSDVSYTSVQSYLEHTASHHGVHVCTFCVRAWGGRGALARHLKEGHPGEKKAFTCHHCHINFTNRWVLMRHMKSKHSLEVESVLCGECGGVFAGNRQFMDHLLNSHQGQESSTHEEIAIENLTNETSDSNKSAKSAENGKSNYENEKSQSKTGSEKKTDPPSSNTSAIACKICSKSFNTKQTYKKHFTTQHGKRFTISKVLDKKSTICKVDGVETSVEGGYLCDICPKRFLRLVNLEKHVSQHMLSSLHCVKCGHTAPSSQHMEEHLNTCKLVQAAKRNSPLLCPTCGKKLRTQSGLRYHLAAHTGMRRFACPSCGRRFLTATNMRKHVRIVHLQIRPYPCSMCDRRFPSTDHLNKHIRFTHLKKREHVCKECNKTFCQVSHLTQHMWIHTGIKHFTCPYCPNIYSRDCSLNKHLRRKHWEQEKQKYLEQEEFYQNLDNAEQQEGDETASVKDEETGGDLVGGVYLEKGEEVAEVVGEEGEGTEEINVVIVSGGDVMEYEEQIIW